MSTIHKSSLFSIDLNLSPSFVSTISINHVNNSGKRKSLEISHDELENLIDALQEAKSRIALQDNSNTVSVLSSIDPEIIHTITSLYLSGISIGVLSIQYDLEENIIKEILDHRGIIIFD